MRLKNKNKGNHAENWKKFCSQKTKFGKKRTAKSSFQNHTNKWKQRKNYLHKAIMKGESQQSRGDIGPHLIQLSNNWPDYLLSERARFIVVIVPEPFMRRVTYIIFLELSIDRYILENRRRIFFSVICILKRNLSISFRILVLERDQNTQQKHKKTQFSCEIHAKNFNWKIPLLNFCNGVCD